MRPNSLSILVPVYNEEEYVLPLLERVVEAPLPEGMEREIIVVDDGSTDGSIEEVEQDEEGLKTMQVLGENMAWLLKKIHQ